MSFFPRRTGQGRKKRGFVALAVFQFSRQLVSAKAYCSSQNTLIQMIRSCRLYPVPRQWRVWIDFRGRELRLGENNLKALQENIENRILVKNSKYIETCSDLFQRSSIETIAKFATRYFLIEGIGDGGVSKWIWFWCRDDRIRHLRFSKGRWINSTPLTSNLFVIKTVVEIFHNEKAPTQKSLKVKLKGCLPFQIKKIKISKELFKP